MPDNTRPASALRDVADVAAESLTDGARTAAAAIDESRSTAAGLETAASAIHRGADDLPGGDRVRSFARATADRLSTSADYVRRNDTRRMMSDVKTLVTSHPGPALVVSAMLGFLVARSLSRD
ncbi:MAG: hypothetical protein HOP16_06105 [Acidobacteria bacterium]|nr:hypothetical protein [Acidobacteriota bacterium]